MNKEVQSFFDTITGEATKVAQSGGCSQMIIAIGANPSVEPVRVRIIIVPENLKQEWPKIEKAPASMLERIQKFPSRGGTPL